MVNREIELSFLAHTWILDLDGTLVKHNGYLLDGKDSFLEGTMAFLASIPEQDYILILTSRKVEYQEITENFLKDNGVRYNKIIYGIPFGERILINDKKDSGLECAFSLNVIRNQGLGLKLRCNPDK